MLIELEDGKRIELKTGADWRASQREAAGWHSAEFDDAAWTNAKAAAPFGGGPWGKIGVGGDNPYIVPYAFGIPGELRMVYVPKPGAVAVKGLEAGVAYRASHFDPVTGERKPLGDLKRDDAGNWRCETPAGTTHDWLLVLEK
jgi:hypothetical protein